MSAYSGGMYPHMHVCRYPLPWYVRVCTTIWYVRGWSWWYMGRHPDTGVPEGIHPYRGSYGTWYTPPSARIRSGGGMTPVYHGYALSGGVHRVVPGMTPCTPSWVAVTPYTTIWGTIQYLVPPLIHTYMHTHHHTTVPCTSHTTM